MAVPIPIDAKKMKERFGFFLDVAKSLFDQKILDQDRINLSVGRLSVCVDTYFILNHSYKNWRMNDGHNTELPKVAAIACLVISAVQPFFPIEPSKTENRAEVQCNEIFALTLACATMGIDAKLLDQNAYFRLLDFMATSRSTTITQCINAVNDGETKSPHEWDLVISEEDKRSLNAMITILELLSKSKG